MYNKGVLTKTTSYKMKRILLVDDCMDSKQMIGPS